MQLSGRQANIIHAHVSIVQVCENFACEFIYKIMSSTVVVKTAVRGYQGIRSIMQAVLETHVGGCPTCQKVVMSMVGLLHVY